MKPLVFNEANKIWKLLSTDKSYAELNLELEIHKKLLNFFQVGDYYYMVFNVKNAFFDLVSNELTEVLGYAKEKVDVPFFLDKIHKDDQPWFLNFENEVVNFFKKLKPEQRLKYKIRYDYRIRKTTGEYIRILQQTTTIQLDESGDVYRTLVLHTDITHLKQSLKPVLSFIGLEGEPSYLDVVVNKLYLPSATISNRERQVITKLIEGLQSKQIAEVLNISKLTVDTHRRNLLKKAQVKNTTELVTKAIKEGWV